MENDAHDGKDDKINDRGYLADQDCSCDVISISEDKGWDQTDDEREQRDDKSREGIFYFDTDEALCHADCCDDKQS